MEHFMKIIKYTYPQNKTSKYSPYLETYGNIQDLLFFDIETTGLIATNTTLYLIGALYYTDNKIEVIQWFNEDGCSEKDILSSFMDFCKDFSCLVHFNGLHFDLPYLKQKATWHQLDFCLENEMTQIDIYKLIRNYKVFFQLDNMKQTSVEEFLGIQRTDIHSGKDLISVYQRYVATKDSHLEHLLLLHNHDDLLGMPQISTILNYKSLIEQPSIETISNSVEAETLRIIFTFSAHNYLPKRITFSKNGLHINAFEQKAVLTIPIIQDTLYHFFDNYKDYYYLPLEDMAIHKSVAQFVESQNKKKATKNTCYIKKTDVFIPCYSTKCPETFQLNPNDKVVFQCLDTFLSQPKDIHMEYIQNVLKFLL